MNKTAYCLPLMLALAGGAQAQKQSDANAACPQLPADSGLAWQHKATQDSDVCRAMRNDGSEAFGLYIANQSPFKPNRGDREERASIDGHDVIWYRSELVATPGVQARETLLELTDGRVAHVWIQAKSADQLGEALQQAQAMRFRSTRLSIK